LEKIEQVTEKMKILI